MAAGRLRHYAALPASAVDAAGDPVPQAQAGFAIKFGSRTQITGYRFGGYVQMRAHVSRFNWSLNGGYGAWQPSVNRNVDFYEQSHGAWVHIGSLATGADGSTGSLRVLAPVTHNFYAHVIQTTTIWGARSRTMNRYARAWQAQPGSPGWASAVTRPRPRRQRRRDVKLPCPARDHRATGG